MTNSIPNYKNTAITNEFNNTSKLHIKSEHIDAGSCNHVCLCSFRGYPSNNFCKGLGLPHIIEGNFGKTRLDGLDIIYAYFWPNAIFQGNGTTQFFITKKANEEQRYVLIIIFSGRAGGNGYFAFLLNIMKQFLEPQFVDIYVHLDGKRSSFSVENIKEVKCKSFINPVTKKDNEITVYKPKGKIWNIAEFANSKILLISTSILNFDYTNRHAEYAIIEFNGPWRFIICPFLLSKYIILSIL